MNYQPPPPVKSRLARERYRKARRHQLAAIVAVVSLVIAAVVVMIPIVLLARSCGTAGYGYGQAARDPANPLWVREAVAYDLNPAPWFCELDAGHLYAASDSQRRDITYPTFPLDGLAAYALTDNEQTWQSSISAEFSDFYLGGGKLLGFRQFYADPPRIELTAYSTDDGLPAWSVDIPGATGGCIAPQEEIVVVGYYLPDGYRLAAYNIEVEAKSWGMRLPMAGLLTEELVGDVTVDLLVRCWPGLAVYQLANVVGLVAVGRGERLREYAAPAFIETAALDTASETCYVLLHGSGAGTYLLQAMPFRGGSVRDLCSVEGTDDHPRLHAGGGGVVLSYRTDEGRSAPQTSVIGMAGTEPGPVVQQELAGVLADVASLPDSPANSLLALNQQLGADGQPRGWGTLHRIDLNDGSIEQVARFRRPVLYLVHFKEECLVLLLGGDVYSFVPSSNACVRIKRARHPVLDWLMDDQKTRLAVLSYPQRYLEGQAGQPLQVIVYK